MVIITLNYITLNYITLNDTVIYLYISFCSAIISEVSVDENKYRDPWMDKMKTGKGDIGTLSPKWDCSI